MGKCGFFVFISNIFSGINRDLYWKLMMQSAIYELENGGTNE
jgi:hypothetical protein